MDIVSRLRIFMDSQAITNSQFADNCGIPRPTLSQILAGRNKKISDELISKIHTGYPWLNVMWLLFGEGEMESPANTQISEPEKAPEMTHSDMQISEVHEYEDPAPYRRLSIDFGPENSTPHATDEFARYRASVAHTSPSAGRPDSTDTISDTPTAGAFGNTASQMPYDRRPNPSVTDQTASATNTAPASALTADQTNSSRQAPTNTDSQTSDNIADALRHEAAAQPRAHVSLSTAATKRISNIVVFYDDNSFESFVPSSFVD